MKKWYIIIYYINNDEETICVFLSPKRKKLVENMLNAVVGKLGINDRSFHFNNYGILHIIQLNEDGTQIFILRSHLVAKKRVDDLEIKKKFDKIVDKLKRKSHERELEEKSCI
ncbi:MAG: hypothetical protein WC875_04870 [Candidatus Absconditabacterales bacterium]|jgi:DNA transposition AAA+ family ATPase